MKRQSSWPWRGEAGLTVPHEAFEFQEEVKKHITTNQYPELLTYCRRVDRELRVRIKELEKVDRREAERHMLWRSRVLVNMAWALRMLDWYEDAVPVAEKAVRLAGRAGGDAWAMDSVFNNLAASYDMAGDRDRARATVCRAIISGIRFGTVGPMVSALGILSSMERHWGEQSTADAITQLRLGIEEAARGPLIPDKNVLGDALDPPTDGNQEKDELE